jgi:hypothetical protein
VHWVRRRTTSPLRSALGREAQFTGRHGEAAVPLKSGEIGRREPASLAIDVVAQRLAVASSFGRHDGAELVS